MSSRVGQALRNPLVSGIWEIDRRVAALIEEARSLFYEVMLFLKPCPGCGEPSMTMVEDGQALCPICGQRCDPTLAFQSCPDCDGSLVRQVYHYVCSACRRPVRSHYCFEEKVFDAEYFRAHMAESRERKRRKAAMIQAVLSNSRSPIFSQSDPPPSAIPTGIAAALDSILVQPALPEDPGAADSRFDLNRYRTHLLNLVSGCVVQFDGISALIPDIRADRAFRFVAAVYLENDGLLLINNDNDGHLRLEGT